MSEEIRSEPLGGAFLSPPKAATATVGESDRPEVHRQLSPQARNMLNHLRLVALDCRISARTDLFEACASLSASPSHLGYAHASTLMRCLSQALGKTPVLFRPGAYEVSFDEAWLVRLVLASAANDKDSVAFLLRSRVRQPAQRSLAFLIRAMSERLILD